MLYNLFPVITSQRRFTLYNYDFTWCCEQTVDFDFTWLCEQIVDCDFTW